jgi:uncharacterized protein
VRQAYADNIVLYAPGSPVRGNYRGKDEVFGLVGTIQVRAEGIFQLEVHDVLANDEHGVALLHASARREEVVVDDNVVHVLRLRDGKITEIWGHCGDQHAYDAFFALATPSSGTDASMR